LGKKSKQAAEVTAGTVIILGLGAVAAAVAIYEFNKPKTTAGTLPPGTPSVTPPATQTASVAAALR
jgi:hypothetical protein